jgi:UDP-galactopyranose mutase
MSVETSDLLVFSHLRWDFIFQRPQHLMSRYAIHRRVFFLEEPIFGNYHVPELLIRKSKEGVEVVVPHLSDKMAEKEKTLAMRRLIDELIDTRQIHSYSAWYYTPMFLPLTRHLNPAVVLYDMVDELSLMKANPHRLAELETELLKKSDVVFTGGHSIFEAQKHRHDNIHAFPSSIDYAHFAQARNKLNEPADQKYILHPRVGFSGIIDDRMDLELLNDLAILCPNMQFIMIGPTHHIDIADLPKIPNIHYLGKKEYSELPLYLAGWDCAMLPYARTNATRFINSTKTPEYLAAGKPVVSTAIDDIVKTYGEQNLVQIAGTAQEFADALVAATTEKNAGSVWLTKVDAFLSEISWDMTFQEMAQIERKLYLSKFARKTIRRVAPVSQSRNSSSII